jgi:hypothetical protein
MMMPYVNESDYHELLLRDVERDKLADALAAAEAELAKAREEVARLREALQAVLDGHGCQPGYLSHSAVQIARAALESPKP